MRCEPSGQSRAAPSDCEGSGFHFEPEFYPANADLITGGEHDRLGDGNVVDCSPIAALLIFQPPLTAPPDDRGMLHAGGAVGHDDGIAGTTPQRSGGHEG